jgi:hypothetical protein
MKTKFAAYFLAIKDDFCLEESVASIKDLGVDTVLIVSPSTYWSDGSSQDLSDYEYTLKLAKKHNCHFVSANLESAMLVNRAMYAESAYRNYAVDLLNQLGQFDSILTIDSDELWSRESLAQVDDLVRQGFERIDMPLVPVIGIPGLPIDGALDSALAATSPRVRFNWGRSAECKHIAMGGAPILHFSATRRSWEELTDKMRKSAHYPDPTYDFEGWIQNTLPTIQVGSTNVHMYKSPKNIWPRVRTWTAREVAQIPKSLHQYLNLDFIAP